MIKAILWVDHDEAEESAEPDAWFDHQLVGLTVLRDGEAVGKVARVDHGPAQDLLVVDTASGEVLVPFVKAIVTAVDVKAGTRHRRPARRPLRGPPRRADESRRAESPPIDRAHRVASIVRIDVVTIFPEFFGVLDVSLLGKARAAGVIDVQVHDLRDFTHDRHRTVDDTPYGGGAGMVMRPEPWGEALDCIRRASDRRAHRARRPPAARSRRRSPASSRAAAARVRLRPLRGHRPARRRPLRDPHRGCIEVSLGDYVLNGGEVAALAMIEAVARLVPGVDRQPGESRRGEPRGRPARVPELHEAGAVARARRAAGVAERAPRRGGKWRREQQLERTRRVRPDLLPADQEGDG